MTERQVFRSHRDFENRGIVMSIIVLLVGFLTLLMALGFSAWNWASLSVFWTSKLFFATYVLTIIVGTFYLCIILESAIVCLLSVVWFCLWIAPAAPTVRVGTLSTMIFFLVLIAITYFINLCLGIAVFAMRLSDYMTVAWYGSFAGLLFTLFFIALISGAIKATRSKSVESIEGRRTEHGIHGVEPAYHSSVRHP